MCLSTWLHLENNISIQNSWEQSTAALVRLVSAHPHSLIPLLSVCGLCSECGDCPPEDSAPWRPFCPITGDSSLFFRVLQRERRTPEKSVSDPLDLKQEGRAAAVLVQGDEGLPLQTTSVFGRSRSSWEEPDINQVGLLTLGTQHSHGEAWGRGLEVTAGLSSPVEEGEGQVLHRRHS